MASFQDVMDGVARVVGGTKSTRGDQPFWFSGVDAGDGTGVAGLNGCYSVAQAKIQNAPCGEVLLGPGNLHYPSGSADSLGPSQKYSFDNLRLLIYVPRQDPETEMAQLITFRDLVEAAFEAHTTLFNLVNVNQAAVSAWRPTAFKQGADDFLAWDFTIRVFRTKTVTYTLG